MNAIKYFLILFLFYSCDEVISNNDEVTEEDIIDSDLFVAFGNGELEDELYSLYNSNSESLENCFEEYDDNCLSEYYQCGWTNYCLNEYYSCLETNDAINIEDINCFQVFDFTEANNYYQQALDLNPDNVDAHFGFGITEFLMITQDQELYEAISTWSEYFNSGEYSSFNSNPVPNINSFTSFNLSSIANFIPISDGTLFNNLDETPQISDIQNILETSFLNRLNESINHFDIVLETDYSFEITGEMQGNNAYSDLEMDNTEIYILKSQMHFLVAIINLIIAYDFDFPHETYYGTAMSCDEITDSFDWLNQNSTFINIRKENALSSALENLIAVHSSLISAIDYLENETDFQTDDIISKEQVEENYNEINEDLDLMYDFINGNYFDDEITVNISNYLNSPIANLKTLLPEYEIVIDNCFNECGEVPCPKLNWIASTVEEWKLEFSDPTLGGLFPEFSIDDMFNYFNINCTCMDDPNECCHF